MDKTQERSSLIAVLASKSPSGKIGRTALMKLMYFLQVLKEVPLEYRFRLHSYGPYDAEVLSDLDYAKSTGQVQEDIVHYPGGYGYDIQSAARETSSSLVEDHAEEINWVVKEFGELTASDLELVSTIVFVDRESSHNLAIGDLSKRVHQIKPHFSEETVKQHALDLKSRGLVEFAES